MAKILSIRNPIMTAIADIKTPIFSFSSQSVGQFELKQDDI